LTGPRTMCQRMVHKSRRVGTAVWFSLMIGVFVAAMLKAPILVVLALVVLETLAGIWCGKCWRSRRRGYDEEAGDVCISVCVCVNKKLNSLSYCRRYNHSWHLFKCCPELLSLSVKVCGLLYPFRSAHDHLVLPSEPLQPLSRGLRAHRGPSLNNV
jgi:hypothetical protein